jgi:hypothetical protein
MPKGNSGLPFKPSPPHTMGFFVMIAQRTHCQVFPVPCNSANASVRLVSSFYLFSARSHLGPACQSNSLVNSNAVASLREHPHGHVCSVRCPRYNPHSQPSLLHPRFSPPGFILNASDSNCHRHRSRLAFRLQPIRSVQSWPKIWPTRASDSGRFPPFHPSASESNLIFLCSRIDSHRPLCSL